MWLKNDQNEPKNEPISDPIWRSANEERFRIRSRRRDSHPTSPFSGCCGPKICDPHAALACPSSPGRPACPFPRRKGGPRGRPDTWGGHKGRPYTGSPGPASPILQNFYFAFASGA